MTKYQCPVCGIEMKRFEITVSGELYEVLYLCFENEDKHRSEVNIVS